MNREKIGGILVIACGIILSASAYISSGHNRVMAMLMTGGPLVVSGILFLISWLESGETADSA